MFVRQFIRIENKDGMCSVPVHASVALPRKDTQIQNLFQFHHNYESTNFLVIPNDVS